MAVPVPRTYVASEFISATTLNGDIRDVHNFMLEPPRVFAYHTASTALTDNVWTLVSLGAELYDPYSTAGHDNVTNNSRVVARETGLYTIHNQIRTSDLSGTIFQMQVRKNSAGSDTGGTRIFLQSQTGAGGGQVTQIGRSVDYPLNTGDYVEMFIFVNTGGSPDATLGSGADATFLSIRFVTKQ
jgi:hypothetical protein